MKKEKLKFTYKHLPLFYIIFMIFIIFLKEEELKRVINHLKYKSSNYLYILEDLYKLLENCLFLTYLNQFCIRICVYFKI